MAGPWCVPTGTAAAVLEEGLLQSIAPAGGVCLEAAQTESQMAAAAAAVVVGGLLTGALRLLGRDTDDFQIQQAGLNVERESGNLTWEGMGSCAVQTERG
jgi:hypothetical protein